ncbi:MAG TPA: aminopeptidase P N-terminal domain-containing protein, partial [Longimicrobiaceae bacterium]|nr:aminopeptidase P N-terminal domain-containing protein [Longimicrobiaceae bacterium]
MAKGHDVPGFPPEAFRARRERYLQRAGNAVTVLPAAPERFRSRDTELRFRQDSDFHYLTGFPEAEAVAVLSPHDAERRFTLFVRPRDPASEVVYALGAHPEMDRRVTALLGGFRSSRPRSGTGPLVLRDPDTLLAEMRLVKEPAELELHRRAARITVEGHLAAMRAGRPGIGEWELESLLDGHFRAAGGGGPAYPTIVGSGAGATTLHYVANDRRARDGDLVLIDAGAEVGMYAADITRTWPVSGRFTPAQRAVYEIVLEAEEAAIAAVRPGVPVLDAHDAAVR